MPEHAEQMSFS